MDPLGIFSSTLNIIDRFAAEKSKKSAMYRLLFLEIESNLGILKTIHLTDDDAPKCNDMRYRVIADGLDFSAHQVMLTAGFLDDEELSSTGMSTNALELTRNKFDKKGGYTKEKVAMKASHAMRNVIVGTKVIQSLDSVNPSPELMTNVRYGKRLENIQTYEAALRKVILSNEMVKPLESR